MNITRMQKTEDCFDGSSVFQYWFDGCWDRESIQRLREWAAVDYFPDFPRPFFRARWRNGLQIKGVEAEDNCQVILPAEGKEAAQANLARTVLSL